MVDIPFELVTKASHGDAAAFEEIYRRSSGFVYSVALRVTGSAAEAEEVTQEAFIRAYRSLGGFGFRSSFTTWLYRIATNLAVNAYRRKAREAGRRAEYDDAVEAVPAEPEAGKGIDREDTERTLRDLLAVLTPEHRACIVLREIEGLRYEEMAAALHININTVRTRLKRAREALMAAAKKRGVAHEMR